MIRDKRYGVLKVMIETGNISSFPEIFTVVPRSVIASDLGINYNRFLEKLKNLQDFTFRDILTLASFLNIDNQILVNIILSDINKTKGSKKKK